MIACGDFVCEFGFDLNEGSCSDFGNILYSKDRAQKGPRVRDDDVDDEFRNILYF